MRRGTTPTHIFTLPISVEQCAVVRIIYAQGGESKLIKNKEDLSFENGVTAKVTLTQEDTFLFNSRELVEIQVRIKTLDGTALASEILKVRVERLLENEVL